MNPYANQSHRLRTGWLKTTGGAVEQLPLRVETEPSQRPLIPFNELPEQVRKQHARVPGNE